MLMFAALLHRYRIGLIYAPLPVLFELGFSIYQMLFNVNSLVVTTVDN